MDLLTHDSEARIWYPVSRVRIEWTSDGGGDFNEVLNDGKPLSGTLEKVVFIPGAGGDQPSANYDITLLDEFGIDVLNGRGVNLNNAANVIVCPGVQLLDGTTTSITKSSFSNILKLIVAGGGVSKKGTVVIYYR